MITAFCESKPLVLGARCFRILPAGLFRASDGSGRPKGVPGWVMDAAAAQSLIAAANARQSDYFIDYEHQSLTQNGSARAAGWFKQMEWRDGADAGLYVTDARWTKDAFKMTRNGEYRYISPVFGWNPQSGRVERLLSVALTNNPALDGLTDLMAATALHSTAEGNVMPDLLQRMIDSGSIDNLRHSTAGFDESGWVNGRPPPYLTPYNRS